jgi:hypothetical protein
MLMLLLLLLQAIAVSCNGQLTYPLLNREYRILVVQLPQPMSQPVLHCWLPERTVRSTVLSPPAQIAHYAKVDIVTQHASRRTTVPHPSTTSP